MNDSRREEPEDYQDVIDYRMSEKFGLDWKQHDYQRMRIFIEIMGFEAERAEKDRKKNQRPSN